MPYDPQRHHRRSIRLPGYDYTRAGAYFITLVTHDRECLFGEIVGGEMRLNTWGEIAREEWFQTAVVRPYVMLRDDEFVVMPNHIHGIIWIVGDYEGNGDEDIVGAQRRCAHVGTQRRCAPTWGRGTHAIRPIRGATPTNVIPGSLGAIIRAYKSATTKRINALRGTPGASVWQRNYYEHIIRDEEDLQRIRQYIQDNPARWAMDRENPVYAW